MRQRHYNDGHYSTYRHTDRDGVGDREWVRFIFVLSVNFFSVFFCSCCCDNYTLKPKWIYNWYDSILIEIIKITAQFTSTLCWKVGHYLNCISFQTKYCKIAWLTFIKLKTHYSFFLNTWLNLLYKLYK